MTLTSFNSYLLTKLVRNFRLGSDPRSLMKRHQILSIIYANFSLILMIIFYEVASVLLGIAYHNLPAMIVPFVILSFVCIRIGKNDIATVSVLIYAHGVNAYVSYYRFSSLGALAAVFMFPNFSFFMSSSSKVQIINMVMCILQVMGHIRNFLQVFKVTLTQEQNDEINHLVAVAIPCLSFLCFTLIAQKSLENGIWSAARMTQENTERINQEIMQAVEAKDSFISSLSHEIRNPLNAMNGSINYLLKVIKDSQSQQVLSNAKISGETLLHLFNNLLDAAKLKSDKMELSYDDMSLFDAVKKVLIINCENMRSKKIFAEIFFSKSIPQIIRSDSARLLQILMNLLSNSLKFTPESGKIIISVTLWDKYQSKDSLLALINEPSHDTASSQSISSQSQSQTQPETSLSDINDHSFTEEFSFEEAKSRTENLKSLRTFETKALDQVHTSQREIYKRNLPWVIHYVDTNEHSVRKLSNNYPSLLNIQDNNVDYFLKMQISDSGCGIAKENIPKLFEMFTQAHNRVTSAYGGTGLGLWICKQLCQKMGGDIKLYSEIGKGTSFVFYLPVNNRHIIEPTASESNEIGTGRDSDKVSCLVVDDFNYNRDLYKLLLEREGVHVIVASDGEEAIKKYLANIGKLDFIMMDVQMPKVDGFTAAKKIRELEAMNKWKRVDIYFVSGEYYNEEEVMASFKTHGGGRETVGIQSLKKPVDIEAIVKIVAKYTKKRR